MCPQNYAQPYQRQSASHDDALHSAQACILVVDDEPSWCSVLQRFLYRRGFATVAITQGIDAVSLAPMNCFDVLVLDLDMPEMDGMEVCRRIRRLSTVPIVFMSAEASTAQVVAALHNGADDFVAKDKYYVELAPRIQALLRRQRRPSPRQIYQQGDLFVHVEQRIVVVRNQQVVLTPPEFDLLLYLIRHAGKAVSKERLSAAVWETPFNSDEQLRTLIRRLREKLEVNPSRPAHIQTVRGVGYRLG